MCVLHTVLYFEIYSTRLFKEHITLQSIHNLVNKQLSDPTCCQRPAENKELVLKVTTVSSFCLVV